VIIVSSRLKVAAESRAEWLEAAKELTLASLNEERGCLDFVITPDILSADTIFIYMRYEDDLALQQHVLARHLVEFGFKVQHISITEGPELWRYEVTSGSKGFDGLDDELYSESPKWVREVMQRRYPYLDDPRET
jgi:quinol monooxygenase YgiN